MFDKNKSKAFKRIRIVSKRKIRKIKKVSKEKLNNIKNGLKLFGRIKKEDIYICGSLVCQTRIKPSDEKDILCVGKNNSMFVYDLDNLILVKCGDYFLNLEAITHYSEFSRISRQDKYNNTYFKSKSLSKESLQKIVDQDDPDFNEKFFVIKDNLIPYNDRFALEELPDVKIDKDYLTFRQLKKLHERSVIRRNGIDNLPIYAYGEHQPRSR